MSEETAEVMGDDETKEMVGAMTAMAENIAPHMGAWKDANVDANAAMVSVLVEAGVDADKAKMFSSALSMVCERAADSFMDEGKLIETLAVAAVNELFTLLVERATELDPALDAENLPKISKKELGKRDILRKIAAMKRALPKTEAVKNGSGGNYL